MKYLLAAAISFTIALQACIKAKKEEWQPNENFLTIASRNTCLANGVDTVNITFTIDSTIYDGYTNAYLKLKKTSGKFAQRLPGDSIAIPAGERTVTLTWIADSLPGNAIVEAWIHQPVYSAKTSINKQKVLPDALEIFTSDIFLDSLDWQTTIQLQAQKVVGMISVGNSVQWRAFKHGPENNEIEIGTFSQPLQTISPTALNTQTDFFGDSVFFPLFPDTIFLQAKSGDIVSNTIHLFRLN